MGAGARPGRHRRARGNFVRLVAPKRRLFPAFPMIEGLQASETRSAKASPRRGRLAEGALHALRSTRIASHGANRGERPRSRWTVKVDPRWIASVVKVAPRIDRTPRLRTTQRKLPSLKEAR